VSLIFIVSSLDMNHSFVTVKLIIPKWLKSVSVTIRTPELSFSEVN